MWPSRWKPASVGASSSESALHEENISPFLVKATPAFLILGFTDPMLYSAPCQGERLGEVSHAREQFQGFCTAHSQRHFSEVH